MKIQATVNRLIEKIYEPTIRFIPRKTLTVFLIFCTAYVAFPQNGNGNGNGNGNNNGIKDILVRSCVKEIGNGLYSATFGYDNPNKKEISVAEDGSFVMHKNKRSKGVGNFKKGTIDKAFTRQFTAGEYVEWTVINPNGKTHVVRASANSSHCTDQEDDGVIFPVYGQGTGKTDLVVGLELTALAEGNAGDNPSDLIYQIRDGKVLIEIIPQTGQLQNVVNLVTGTYNLQYNTDPLLSDFIVDPTLIIAEQLATVDVFFPISQLLELNDFANLINFVRPIYPPSLNSGIVTSQGDGAQASDLVRNAFKIVREGEVVSVDGTGVKVGVISDSYNTQPFTGKSKAEVDVENGDLPGAANPNNYISEVEVIQDFPYGVASDEGRAMMQIIHDVAPGAELAFHTGILSPRSFELGIKALDLAGCTVITDDITFPAEPFFRDGRIANAIKDFNSAPNKKYVTSAGNFSNSGYQSTFNTSTDLPATNFLEPGSATRAHVFGTNADGSEDVYQKISVVPGVYMIVLQWDEDLASQENSTGATDDLDIYLVDDQGRLVVGNNRINEAGDPTEIIVFQATGVGDTNILITSANGATNTSFRYIAFQSNGLEFLEYNSGSPTVSGHAMTAEAITVGAVDYRAALNPQSQAFSSFAGQLSNNQNIEVNISAVDGVNTNVSSIGQDLEGDGFTNFFGTSAAAPHVAAAFALLNSAATSWYPDGLPVDGLQLFQQTATQFGNPDVAGSGLINVNNAFKQIASQTANLTQLIVEDGKTPSAEPIEVTILGEFLPENPKVFFDGEELEIISVTENEITTIVGAFTGNPDLIVFTEPTTPGGTDAGNSNPLNFFDDGKIAFNIKADDASIEFGQAADFSFSVEGLPDGVTYESLGLPEIKFTTPAVFPYPDANNYVLTPYFDGELTEEQAAAYQINFLNGLFTVTKKDLIIKPQDATYNYGEPVVVDLDFIYDTNGIADNNDFLSNLTASYETTFLAENTLALINKLRGVVNEQEILNLLNSGSWMATERVIQNKLRGVVNGMNVIDLEVQNFIDYINAETDPQTNKLKAVVNKLKAVVNGVDLLSNNIDLVIENKLRPVVNDTGLGDENDLNDYSQIFAIVDAEDASTETEERTIDKLYSLNLITGLDVTDSDSERHYMYPGAFLAPIAANFNITYESGRLAIQPATLQASSQDILINQGETPDGSAIVTNFSGFAYDDTSEIVFPDGITYRFIDEFGDDYQTGDTGVFEIKIDNPQNYTIEYATQGLLYVNPFGNMKKVRTYLDCVEYSSGDPSGFDYIANFRYVNSNSETIFVLLGEDNFLSGEAQYEGELPTIFLPGEGTFEIRFDGEKLIWNLATFESTHKTSVSSEASSSSNRCNSTSDAGDENYSIYPNPVQDVLTIQKNITGRSDVDIFDTYGNIFYQKHFKNKANQSVTIDMSSYPAGLYFVRVTTQHDTKVYNIIKE